MSHDGARKAYLKALKLYQADQYWQAGQDFAAVLRRDPHYRHVYEKDPAHYEPMSWCGDPLEWMVASLHFLHEDETEHAHDCVAFAKAHLPANGDVLARLALHLEDVRSVLRGRNGGGEGLVLRAGLAVLLRGPSGPLRRGVRLHLSQARAG
jgi:hypothetical protein